MEEKESQYRYRILKKSRLQVHEQKYTHREVINDTVSKKVSVSNPQPISHPDLFHSLVGGNLRKSKTARTSPRP